MRNPELTRKRDYKLVEGFYHLYDEKRVRLDDVLCRIGESFFLSADYVYKRIFYNRENLSYYERLKRCKGNTAEASQRTLDF